MTPLRPLGLSANQWQFLSKPDAYVNACPQLNLESTRRQFLTARDILARLNGSCHRRCDGRRHAVEHSLGLSVIPFN